MTFETDVCGVCGIGTLTRFENRTISIEHEGLAAKVEGLSGAECSACGDILFDPASAIRYAEAGDHLEDLVRAKLQANLRRVRRKLKLSQAQAAKLTGGGHNAFSRYENGQASPMPAVTNLFKLLDRHPELLNEILPNDEPANANATPAGTSPRRTARAGIFC
jgi:HTH-type transcriptional regulator/antitoxin MqsA